MTFSDKDLRATDVDWFKSTLQQFYILVEAVLGHLSNKLSISHNLGHSSQSFTSRTPQDGVTAVKCSLKNTDEQSLLINTQNLIYTVSYIRASNTAD